MLHQVLRRTSIAALCAAAVVAGCSKGDRNNDSALKADSAAAAATTPPPAPPAPTMTDANILAALDEANAADSSTGALAASKGTSADVRSFGRQMVNDHHAMRKQGADLAKKLNITPQPPADDHAPADAKAFQDSLTAMAKGAAWDKAYIDHEVADHEEVLKKAQDMSAAAQNQEVKDLIAKAAPKVQEHLDKAKSIQSKLATP